MQRKINYKYLLRQFRMIKIFKFLKLPLKFIKALLNKFDQYLLYFKRILTKLDIIFNDFQIR